MTLLRSKPMRRVSDRQQARNGTLAKVKRELLRRAGYRPECCDERDVRLEHHHVFGRSGLGAWNDSAECGAVVCQEHHRRLTDEQEPELKELLQRAACLRLSERLMAETGSSPLALRVEYSASQVARDLVARLEAAGIEP